MSGCHSILGICIYNEHIVPGKRWGPYKSGNHHICPFEYHNKYLCTIVPWLNNSFLYRKVVAYARLRFRQMEETYIMENVLYNDLVRRGMNVDVGVVEYNTKDANGKKIRKQLEVDFVVNQGGKRF